MKTEGNLAVITARGGSKRIPYKNIKDFCGKPIIAYSIEASKSSGIFDEVMVSTDDEEIRRIALQYGAKVPFMRSVETSNDFATTIDVLLEVISAYEKTGRKFRNLCCIYPTAPFVTGDKLRMAMEMLQKENIHTVIPVVPFSFPPQRGFVLKDGNLLFQYPENALKRSQDLEMVYHDAGQFYCVNVQKFCQTKKLIADHVKPIILDELEVQDIDNMSDWDMAELKYKIFNAGKGN